MKTIIYPGTFDPITNGHIDIVERATKLFDRVVVAIALSNKKNTTFNLEERLRMSQISLAHLTNVEICTFSCLLVDLAREKDAFLILRGLRAVSDFEYEFQLAGLYRQLEPRIETMFLMPAEKHLYISSSMVKEIAFLNGNIDDFVHPEVKLALNNKKREIHNAIK